MVDVHDANDEPVNINAPPTDGSHDLPLQITPLISVGVIQEINRVLSGSAPNGESVPVPGGVTTNNESGQQVGNHLYSATSNGTDFQVSVTVPLSNEPSPETPESVTQTGTEAGTESTESSEEEAHKAVEDLNEPLWFARVTTLSSEQVTMLQQNIKTPPMSKREWLEQKFREFYNSSVFSYFTPPLGGNGCSVLKNLTKTKTAPKPLKR